MIFMIYFFDIVSGILFLIFAAIHAMIEMHINYKKSIPKLKNSPESTQMAQRLHIIADLINRMVIAMIDIRTVFCPLTPERTFYLPLSQFPTFQTGLNLNKIQQKYTLPLLSLRLTLLWA